MAETVIELIESARSALARRDTQELARIVEVYRAMFNRLTPQIQALAEQISSGSYTLAQVKKLNTYVQLQETINGELQQFAAYMKTSIEPMALAAAKQADEEAFKMLRFMVGNRELIRVPFDQIPKEALYKMLTFLNPTGTLYERISMIAPTYADAVGAAILDAIGMGTNPKQTARAIIAAAEGAYGRGLVDALRMARTTQLWSYREATRANYAANGDVVTGWIWFAELDDKTCMSCVAQHGTKHTMEENLDDHYNGRCAMVPEIFGRNPLEGMETGQEWFGNLPQEKQVEMMGPGKYEAWQDGQFNFNQLSQQRAEPVYQHMHNEATLKDLIGEK